jgi:predicted ATP-dependent endonuclease of OLD family
MYIKTIHIENFRNFTHFETDFEPFTVITGANNSGKTNLFVALEKVLSLTSLRNTRISQSDFNSAVLPIIIEITLDQLTDHDISAFYNPSSLINAKENTLKIHFEAKWDADEEEVISECYFVRDDLEENRRGANYTRNYREYISHYFTSSFQSVNQELSFSQKQSFGKVLRAFAGDYMKPIEVLLSHLASSVQQFLEGVESTADEVLSEEHRNKIAKECNPIIRFCKDTNIALLDQSINYDDISTELKSISKKFNELIAELTIQVDDTDSLNLFNKQSEKISIQLDTINKRLRIRKDLRRWSSELQVATPFENANIQLLNIFGQIFRDQDISFQMLPIGDEELINSVSAILDEIPLANYGDGYKSLFNIGLGLTEVLATRYSSEKKSAVTCLFIEEIERNLHPHMQRHIINQLRKLQETWKNEERHLQIILTTHSPSCLKRVTPTELVQLRSDSHAVKWTQSKLEELAKELEPDDSELNKRRKKLNKLIIWADRLFNEFAEAILNNIVIIAEGETEQGFITELAEHISDPDYYGITTINAGGGGQIQYISAILLALEIPFICVADKKDQHNLDMVLAEHRFVTNHDDFEHEIMATGCYEDIILALEEFRSEDSINQIIGNLRGNGFPSISSISDLIGSLDSLTENQETALISQLALSKQKSIRFGQLLAKNMVERSPEVYCKAIRAAMLIAKGENNGS